MGTEIVVFYVSEDDVKGSRISPGWYFENDYTEVPEGPFTSKSEAEYAGTSDYETSDRLHHPIKAE